MIEEKIQYLFTKPPTDDVSPIAVFEIGQKTEFNIGVMFGLFNIKIDKSYGIETTIITESGETLKHSDDSIEVSSDTAIAKMNLTREIVEDEKFLFSVNTAFTTAINLFKPLVNNENYRLKLELKDNNKVIDSKETLFTLSPRSKRDRL
ncbi:hypothetical protein AYO51_15790 [Lactiplantibacillus plantarum]|uniref:hypothetical protein n=1 Tax=Lactiplantibacillus plantarum TaxID=1590 RepID=UPI0007899821|nr:hypothetical protein [Lactiplantibacillus plantarum]KYK53576.1 hypothetical protein AYO51_15790 [Lactiplantibacillus plantarum]KYM70867.1 hypothetical protein AZJ01_17475 [Lactiplantibacillus plantarum]